MKINLDFDRIGKGSFADIFKLRNTNIALKLYKSFTHPDRHGDTAVRNYGGVEIANDFIKKVFEDESKAYELVQFSELLKKYTPSYYGTPPFSELIDNDGTDISNWYVSGCCIAMEYIEGKSEKLGFLMSVLQSKNIDYQSLEKEFNLRGINFITDAHAIYNEKRFCIIDFGTRDFGEFEPVQ